MNLLPHATPAHAYLIVAAIVLGVLAGPGILGRAAPDLHRSVFGGADPTQAQAMLEAHRAETTANLERMEAVGVTKIAVDEYLAQRANVETSIHRALGREQVLHIVPMTTAVVLVLLAVMILESVVAPLPDAAGRAVVSPTLGRLVTVRYGLIGLWVMLVLAQPATLWSLKPLFVALLLVVALAAGLTPLGSTSKPTGAGEKTPPAQ